MFSNVGKKCFKLRCLLCAVQFVTLSNNFYVDVAASVVQR